jgi:RNA polymerase primary sigma factor
MAAEKRPTASHRGTDVDHLSIEEKYDEVRQLINIGKEKGYLLYDEVNELLPSEITSSDELDDLFNTFGSAGIEVIDSDQKYLRDDVKPIDRTAEGRRGARARSHAGRARQDQRSRCACTSARWGRCRC